MESEDPLSQLADIHLPDPVSFWPLAPGWWLVIVLILAGLCWLGFQLLKKIMLNRRLQTAQRELIKAIQAYRDTINNKDSDPNKAGLDYLYAVNTVLNRVALYTDPKHSRDIAKLSGNPWLEYLDHAYGGTEFKEGSGKVLAEGQYRPVFRGEIEALYTLAQSWINTCYKEKNKTQSGANSNIKVAA
ncbi:DUF4381 domain-containing protein [Haliea sp. AH-315-K21]|uniref:DUF4381 domain-containing protein n=1 Tax=SAR86 cluster bacterium TaxID=2030880 RepID=A0A2A5CE24_9GAMM|nr:DUF4381 domain-containing protein [Haliea sp. AH-315-K21]MBN4075176.1 DUF4381 domain-containing protein [Gammaproteobacteria bacterium AH-315-E17]PCJ42127.1 MAG: hypothetical protein COA71_05920 [SAR86 cluster bacterium]